ncbi:unnamed protein product [Pleuronectes platessa]|uniref:Uncharacterized protein n=1 Tax=Pleuronectes platessa TaxID=8262 RepID=A0A9N7VJ88_PLEPL|nr:unnamed protein product [Pleuronectes platessa]
MILAHIVLLVSPLNPPPSAGPDASIQYCSSFQVQAVKRGRLSAKVFTQPGDSGATGGVICPPSAKSALPTQGLTDVPALLSQEDHWLIEWANVVLDGLSSNPNDSIVVSPHSNARGC